MGVIGVFLCVVFCWKRGAIKKSKKLFSQKFTKKSQKNTEIIGGGYNSRGDVEAVASRIFNTLPPTPTKSVVSKTPWTG